MVLPPQPHPAAPTSVTVITPPITCQSGWCLQQAAGRLQAMAPTANTSITWTSILTRTPTPHPPPHAHSTSQLRIAAPPPHPLSAPTSTSAPLPPHHAQTPHDLPTQPGSPVRKEWMPPTDSHAAGGKQDPLYQPTSALTRPNPNPGQLLWFK